MLKYGLTHGLQNEFEDALKITGLIIFHENQHKVSDDMMEIFLMIIFAIGGVKNDG